MTVSIGSRAFRLNQRLLGIRTGSGAIRLPQNVKRVNLRFAQKSEGRHLGARKLWRKELVTLKYHNPAVPITVDQNAQQTDQAILSIHFAEQDAPQTSASETSSAAAIDTIVSPTAPSDAAPTTRVEAIDVTGKGSEDILAAIIEATKATIIQTSVDDEALREDLDVRARRNAIQAAKGLELRKKLKREQEIARRAREGVNG